LVVMLLTVLAWGSEEARAALYWSTGTSIGRSNLDGSNANPEFISSLVYAPIGHVCGIAVNESHIFWADSFRGAIGRANIDGSDPNYFLVGDAREPCGVALDESYLYWANRNGGFLGSGPGPGSIGRVRLDGSEKNQDFIPGISVPCGTAVDDQFVFWTAGAAQGYVGRALLAGPTIGPALVDGLSGGELCGAEVSKGDLFWGYGNAIGRVATNGSEPDVAFIAGIERPCDIAVNDSHIYWSEETLNGRIARATLDGGSVEPDIAGAGHFPCGVAVDDRPVPPLPPPPEPGPELSRCAVKRVHANRHKGTAVVVLGADYLGSVNLNGRGIRARVLGRKQFERSRQSRWRLKIWPRKRGRVGKRIRRQLTRKGWAKVRLRARCLKEGPRAVETSKAKLITLRRSRAARSGASPVVESVGTYWLGSGDPARKKNQKKVTFERDLDELVLFDASTDPPERRWPRKQPWPQEK
jgi:hypothetical protein